MAPTCPVVPVSSSTPVFARRASPTGTSPAPGVQVLEALLFGLDPDSGSCSAQMSRPCTGHARLAGRQGARIEPVASVATVDQLFQK